MPPVEASKATEAMKKAMNKDSIVGKIIQIVIGLLILLIVYFIFIKVINSDSLVSKDPLNQDIKRQVYVIDGYADSSQVAGNTYNTVTPFATNALTINPSSNIKGGAQFTYSLWLNMGSTNDLAGKTIFLRGDAKKYSYNITDTMTGIKNTNTDYVAFCPALTFGTNKFDFVVRFNTMDNMNEQLYVQNITDINDLYRKNLLSLYTGKWFLITIVFEDNTPINDFENGIIVKFYINDQMYAMSTYSSMLKQNNGNLYLFPDGSIPKLMISNMMYFNYALGPDEIRNNYNQGPSNKSSSTVTKSFISPLLINDMNRLDIYNA